MADFAFDPYSSPLDRAIPFGDRMAQQQPPMPQQAPAQPPAPPPVALPPLGPPSASPMPTIPQPPSQQQTALPTTAKPPLTPGVGPGQIAEPEYSDEEELRIHRANLQSANKVFSTTGDFKPMMPERVRDEKGNLVLGPYGEPIDSGILTNPEFVKWKQIQELLPTLKSRSEISQVNSMQRQTWAKMQAQEKEKQAAREKQERQERAARKFEWEKNPENRTKLGNMSTDAIGMLEADQKAKAEASINGPEKDKAAYTIRTSPITHLQPDAKRSITASLQMLNPKMEAPEAALIMNILGSSVGTDKDDGTGKWKVGVNGRRGKGAAKYREFGRDIDNNFIVEVPVSDDPRAAGHFRKVIVDKDSMALLELSREKAYGEAVKWEEERRKAIAKSKEPGWIERGLKAIIPPQGVPSPRGP